MTGRQNHSHEPLGEEMLGEHEDLESNAEVPDAGAPSRDVKIIVSVLIAAAVGIALLLAFPHFGPDTPVAPVAKTAAKGPSIAVLPFQNTGNEADLAWLSPAFAEMLAIQLGETRGAVIVRPERTFAAVRELDVDGNSASRVGSRAQVARAVGADLLVTGSYERATGDAVRLEVSLSRPRQEKPIARIDAVGEYDALGNLVANVAAAISRELGSEAEPRGRAFPPSTGAVRQYTEGQQLLRSFETKKAVERLQKAVAVAPGFALAHSALASAWNSLGYDHEARKEARIAFDLAASLPDFERALIEAKHKEAMSDWKGAAAIYTRLLDANPRDVDLALRQANALIAAGSGNEAISVITRLRNSPVAVSDPNLALAAAEAYRSLGDYQQMLLQSRIAQQGAKERGLQSLLAQALSLEGLALSRVGEATDAERALDESAKLHRELGNLRGLARVKLRAGAIHVSRGDHERASREFRDALALGRETGDKWTESGALVNTSYIAIAQGDLASAREVLGNAIAVFDEVRDRYGLAVAYDNLGHVLYLQGNLAAAKSMLERSLVLSKEISNSSSRALALFNLGEIARAEGRLVEARKLHQEALDLRRRSGDQKGSVESALFLALLDLDEGQMQRSSRAAAEAVNSARRASLPDVQALGSTILALASASSGDRSTAVKALEEARSIPDHKMRAATRLDVAIGCARVEVLLGKRIPAEEQLSRVIDEARQKGLVPQALEAELVLAQITRSGAQLLVVEREAASKGFALLAARAMAAARMVRA